MIDALLGAAGLGDIGQHFPDTDPRFEDADSVELLAAVVAELGERGFAIGNVDATVVLERPEARAAPGRHPRDAGGALGLAPDAVNVKATTGERMGFVGRGEGRGAGRGDEIKVRVLRVAQDAHELDREGPASACAASS